MKTLPLVFAVSLAANLALAVVVLRRSPAPASDTPVSTSVAAAAAAPTFPSSATPTRPAPLASDDFNGLAARLDAAGIPPHIARMAVGWAIRQHFEDLRVARGLSFDAGSIGRRPVTHATSESAEITAARTQIDREEQELMRRHIGEERPMSSNAQRQMTAGLPVVKGEALLKIVRDYRQMEAQLHTQDAHRGSPENRAKVALLESERRADIEKLLTAEELLEYDLRNSTEASMLRNRLGPFKVSEAEFRALYTAYKQAEAAADAAGVPKRGRDRDAHIEPALRQTLGEARHADRELAKQLEAQRVRSFSATQTFIRNLNLPQEATNDVLVLQADLRPRLAALQQARTATPEQREAQIAALTREAERQLTVILGPQGFARYRNEMGQWLGSP